MSEHHRDREAGNITHEREEDLAIPAWAKWSAEFINRIGFPIFAFCMLAYFYWVGLTQNTRVIGELRDVMMSVRQTLQQDRGR